MRALLPRFVRALSTIAAAQLCRLPARLQTISGQTTNEFDDFWPHLHTGCSRLISAGLPTAPPRFTAPSLRARPPPHPTTASMDLPDTGQDPVLLAETRDALHLSPASVIVD